MKKMIIKLGVAVVFAYGVLPIGSQKAFADLDPAHESVLQTKTFFERLSDYGTLSYYGIYQGAPLSNLGSSYQPTPLGVIDENTPQRFDSTITAGYKFAPNWMAGIVGHFYYHPIGNPAGTGQDIQML